MRKELIHALNCLENDFEKAVRIDEKAERERIVEEFKNDDEEKAENLLHAFERLGLCNSCWLKFQFLKCGNTSELAKRILKWFRGGYSNNRVVEKRLKQKLDEVTEEIKVSERERICKIIDKYNSKHLPECCKIAEILREIHKPKTEVKP